MNEQTTNIINFFMCVYEPGNTKACSATVNTALETYDIAYSKALDAGAEDSKLDGFAAGLAVILDS